DDGIFQIEFNGDYTGLNSIELEIDDSGMVGGSSLAELTLTQEGRTDHYRRNYVAKSRVKATQNSIWHLVVTGDTDDDFTLTVNGYETEAIAYDADEADIQAAILDVYPDSETMVTPVLDDMEAPIAGEFYIEFVGRWAGNDRA